MITSIGLSYFCVCFWNYEGTICYR